MRQSTLLPDIQSFYVFLYTHYTLKFSDILYLQVTSFILCFSVTVSVSEGWVECGWGGGLNQAISPWIWPQFIPQRSHFRNEVRFAPKIKKDRVGNGGRSGQLATNPPGSWEKAKHRQCFKNFIQPPPIHFWPYYSSVKGLHSYFQFGKNKNRFISDNDADSWRVGHFCQNITIFPYNHLTIICLLKQPIALPKIFFNS